MNLGEKNGLRTWLEINKKSFVANLQTFKKIAGKQKFMAVIKSNAYGHEIETIAKWACDFGVDYFGVDSILEAEALRKLKIKNPILVLGYTLPNKLQSAGKNKIEITISSFFQLDELEKANKKFNYFIHLKIDSGMSRQGFKIIDQEKLAERLIKLPKNIKIIGLYSHLASADLKEGKEQTEKQLKEFSLWHDFFIGLGFKDLIKHVCATSGVLEYQKQNLDMVRVGIGLYGIWPSDYLRKKYSGKIKLEPVLKWKTLISEIKKIEKGSCIGYDCFEKPQKDSKIAICPVGYWHGYPRAFSGRAFVLVGREKKPAKVLGLVSMDMIAIDVSGIKTRPNDEVLLMGGDLKLKTNFNQLELDLSESAYELVTRINPLIIRFKV